MLAGGGSLGQPIPEFLDPDRGVLGQYRLQDVAGAIADFSQCIAIDAQNSADAFGSFPAHRLPRC